MRLVPVILSDCQWQTYVGDLQALPSDGGPLRHQHHRDVAFNEVTSKVRELALAIKESRNHPQ